MRYFLNNTWCNDDTVTELPEGAVLVNEAAWEARHGDPIPLPPPTPKQIKNAADLATAKANAQLVTLTGMDATQIANHVNTKSTADPETKKILILLAIGLSIQLREKLE